MYRKNTLASRYLTGPGERNDDRLLERQVESQLQDSRLVA